MFNLMSAKKAFLGANTAEGFVSHFEDCYSADEGWRAYILKGGPGTGKSSMMKKTAIHFGEKGSDVELCPCSSDPDSLDAVIIHDKKTVIMDGTTPHTVDPKYPAVCETIINLSDCWDRSQFCGNEQKIIELTRENKALHSHASRYISAAGELCEDNIRLAMGAVDAKKCVTFARGLVSRVTGEGKGACEHIRFLSGITPKGVLFLRTTQAAYKTVIACADEQGAASSLFMQAVRERALELSHRVITCYNPLNPHRIDHVLLPDADIAFCTENRLMHPAGITRKIHARRFTDTVLLNENRSRLSFNRRASDELLREAVSLIEKAKATHDELEGYYIKAMDFSKNEALTAKIISEIE